MALAFQSGDSVKQALFDEMSNILSANSTIRQAAEARLKQLEIVEGYGVYLAEFIMNQSFNLALRQLASVLLTKYVEEHWFTDDSMISPATDQAKRVIRNILPNGLYDPNSKIRTSVAFTISTIASSDWPKEWTDLFDIIIKCLGGNEDSIHGAMQVLNDTCGDLDSEVLSVGPVIINEVYRIFEAENVYSVRARRCAIVIFKSLLHSLNEFIQSKDDGSKLLNPILPTFIQKLIEGLSSTPASHNVSLKTEIIKVLNYMVNDMPRYIRPYTAQFLPPIWQLLTQSADIYVKSIVNDMEPLQIPDVDPDDDTEAFIGMILQVFELIQSIVDSGKFKSYVSNVLTDLIYIMIVYMQMAEEQVSLWQENPERFVEDEDENGREFSVRISVQTVLTNLKCVEQPGKMLSALSEAISRQVSVAEAEQASGNPHWWKIHEACMLAVANCSDVILGKQNKFNLPEYLHLIRNLMNFSASPYLQGRCLWMMSQFAAADIYNVISLDEILTYTVDSLAIDKPIVLRISAIRSVYGFCDNLREAKGEQRELVISKLGGFLDGILGVMPQMKNNVLESILEALSKIISYDVNFTASANAKVIPITIAMFLKFFDDPYILELIQDILTILSQNPFCLVPLQDKFIPILVSVLNLPSESSHSVMQEITLDVLHTIVKNSKAPISEALISSAFPAAVHCIMHTDDCSVMQSGGECMRAFVCIDPEQVCTYKNGAGLNHIMQVTTILLNPMNTEFSATFIGRLVITIITKLGGMLGENINLLLKAVISKMQLVESLAVIMSLVMTFAYLFCTQMEAVLSFLSTVPGPTGEPAIQYVFTNWLSNQHMFYGNYERKVTTMALCKMFEYGVTSKDARLTSVTIREPVTEARTRSQNQNAQWQTLPVLVKIFKLLILELSQLKVQEELQSDTDSWTDNDEDDVGDDATKPSATTAHRVVSDLFFEDEDDGSDYDQLMQDLLQDPIFQTDMKENLTKFLQNFSRDESFQMFVGHLNDNEKQTLREIQVQVL